MMGKRNLVLSSVALFVTLGFLTEPFSAAASKFEVLHWFSQGKGGSNPSASLIFDAAGNLYGTTDGGGKHHRGTVFQLIPGADGKWTEKVLYNFCSEKACGDGAYPYVGLVFDTAGNLYGTTVVGGAYGLGTVFQLVPGANGNWTEKVLYSFCAIGGCLDGYTPYAGLIVDAAGNLYGNTAGGGSYGLGAVFEVTPGANGSWTETELYSFKNASEGAWPVGSLVLDNSGNLYGSTRDGGKHASGCPNGCGVVFKLTPGANGNWSEQVIHSFDLKHGANPEAGLILDPAGNLYGTTVYGGVGCQPYGCGAVFELSPAANGNWVETVLHSFYVDPKNLTGNLIFDQAGNLYGTAGGSGGNDLGRVFELSPSQSGMWVETVLHSFTGKGGSDPVSGLILDVTGNLYGTTLLGGREGQDCDYNSGCGTVFEIMP